MLHKDDARIAQFSDATYHIRLWTTGGDEVVARTQRGCSDRVTKKEEWRLQSQDKKSGCLEDRAFGCVYTWGLTRKARDMGKAAGLPRI
jgi:hypothetical protein